MLEVLEVERLGDVREDTARERVGRAPRVVVARQHEDGRLDPEAAHVREEFETGHPRHEHVEQHEVERIALASESDGTQNDDRPECRYVIIGSGGNVVRAGLAAFRKDGRFVVDLKDLTTPGLYTVAAALFIGGNAVNPEVRVIEHRVAAALAPRRGVRPQRDIPLSR